MKWGYIVFVLCCLLAVNSFAQTDSFSFQIEPAEIKMLDNESGFFNVTIYNNLPQTEQFQIYTTEVSWSVDHIFTRDRSASIPPGSAKKIEMSIKSLQGTPGGFGIPLHIKASRLNILEKASIFMSVSSSKKSDQEYLPALQAKASFPDHIDPRKEATINLHVKNKNRKNLPNIDVQVISNIFQFNEVMSMKPLEEKNISFNVSFDPLLGPQKDQLKITLLVKEQDRRYRFDAQTVPFEISTYGGVTQTKTTERGFLKSTDTVVFHNSANSRQEYTHIINSSFLKKLFIRTDPDYVFVRKKDSAQLQIQISLDIGEEKTITITKNYQPLFWIIIGIVVLIIAYQFYKTPIVIVKRSSIFEEREGGASGLKVVIAVRNRGPKVLEDIIILDKIPHIASLIREFDAGTLEPTQILKHETRGTLLKWKLDQLDKFEERIISYRIKTKLTVLGNLSLPSAVVKYKKPNGREKIVNSSVKIE